MTIARLRLTKSENLTAWLVARNCCKFKGLIDEVAICNVALTEDDIKRIMTEGFENILAVSPAGKLTTTWVNIKQ